MWFVRYCKLDFLGILGMLGTPVKKKGIDLLNTLMFLCIQKINWIPNFVLEISQRHYKFFWVLETGLAKHIKTVTKVVSTCRKFKCLSACEKSTSSLTTFLRYCIVVVLSTLSMPNCTHQIWQYQLYLLLLSQDTAKILQYCKDFANLLFWVLWARLAILTNW